jgi:Arc/MetJ family transcription regulator
MTAMGRMTAAEHTIKRTTVDLDLDELAQAKETLGTGTTRDTINTALREINRRAALSRAAELIERGGLDVVSPAELAELRRPRLER